MNGKPRRFYCRPLRQPFLQVLLGRAIKQIQVDEFGITFEWSGQANTYAWPLIGPVEIESGTIQGGYPGSASTMKRTLRIAAPDATYEFDISPHRSQIRDHPELVEIIGQHAEIKKRSAD